MPITEKSPFRLKVELRPETGEVFVQVIDRETEDAVETETFNARELPDSIKPTVALYGLSKLLQDRSSDTDSGPSKLDAMREIFAMFKAGQYERERRAGAPVVSAEVEALASLKGITVAQAQAALRKYTKEQREKILANPSIVAKAKEIRAAREDSDVSFDDLANV
jgi:hypothetical protein